MASAPIVVLLTDFGTNDWFVGSMKAAILERAPACTIIDLCHSIEPGAVADAAWLLERTFADFPRGTVFCAVVDPGVGTERRAIAASDGAHFFVAPDNGLLTGVHRRCIRTEKSRERHDWQCRAITNPKWARRSVSHTFHGRDVFAPAAALVARDGGIENAGNPVDNIVEIELPSTVVEPNGAIVGTIVWFDRFGNAVTSIEREAVEAAGPDRRWRAKIGRLTIECLSSTYADVSAGEALAYWGSLGTLEIAVRGADARRHLRLRKGQRVRLFREARRK